LSEGEHRIRDRIDDRSVDADDQGDRSATDPGDNFGHADEGTANKVRNNRNHRLTVEAGAGSSRSTHGQPVISVD